MGFNGEIVVVRSDAAPGHGPESATGIAAHELCQQWPLEDGWWAVHARPDAHRYDQAWLSALSARTGAPVLACWVSESDVAHIRGVSAAGAWEAWLNLPYAAFMIVQDALTEVAGGLSEDHDDDAFDRHMSEHIERTRVRLEGEIPTTAADAVRWAAQAGYAVPAGPIEELLAGPRELFVQWGFFKLLHRLGLTATDFDPDA